MLPSFYLAAVVLMVSAWVAWECYINPTITIHYEVGPPKHPIHVLLLQPLCQTYCGLTSLLSMGLARFETTWPCLVLLWVQNLLSSASVHPSIIFHSACFHPLCQQIANQYTVFLKKPNKASVMQYDDAHDALESCQRLHVSIRKHRLNWFSAKRTDEYWLTNWTTMTHLGQLHHDVTRVSMKCNLFINL